MRPGRFSAERSSGEGATIGRRRWRLGTGLRLEDDQSVSVAGSSSIAASAACASGQGPTALVSVASSCSGRKEGVSTGSGVAAISSTGETKARNPSPRTSSIARYAYPSATPAS